MSYYLQLWPTPAGLFDGVSYKNTENFNNLVISDTNFLGKQNVTGSHEFRNDDVYTKKFVKLMFS